MSMRLTVNLLTENLLKNEPYNLRNVSSFAAILIKFFIHNALQS